MRQPMILDSGWYWEVFEAYRQQFGEGRIKIVWFEEYIGNKTAVFQDVCRFLEIDDTIVPSHEHEFTNNREGLQPRMVAIGRGDTAIDTTWNERTRRWVIDQLREDNRRFLDHFGRPHGYWGDLFEA